ncbi:haloacid dehalogenase [Actinorhabdospora filicis]|uniref:Haloacid dehalogenase n=1 Tax=Actinorhabdospora filicis TaxID=1785913 RepID=A0A9W6W8X5_9ACTN|nr:HAD family hydrolase [Actinorhabdospora filicis]GLZ76926.1 haloacid dehalogenase [Actinorhabdospora filicis]
MTVLLADVGSVLFRFDPAPRLAELSRRTGLAPEVIHERVFASGFETACEEGRHTPAEIRAWLAGHLGLDEDVAAVSRIWTSAFTPDEDVIAALRGRGLPLAIFSNNGPLFADFFDERFPEVAALFPRRFWACGLGLRKPDPAAFDKVTAALKDEIFFVDDNPDNTREARRKGWRAHTFTTVAALEDALAEL